MGEDVSDDHVCVLSLRYLVHRPDPLVQRIDWQVMLGDLEFIVVVDISTDQPLMILQRLDLACEPAEGKVVAGEFLLCQKGDP